MNEVRDRAERFVRAPVQLGDLALTFDETAAATVDVQVGGSTFFPLILDDIASATSSVHINQYGFRPGEVGRAVRPRAARQGRRRGRGAGRGRPGRLAPRPVGWVLRAAAGRRRRRSRRARAGAHRPPQAVRRRRPRRLGRRRGDRGPLRRRPLPRPVRPPHRAGGRAAAARVPRQLPLARRRRRAGAARGALPRARAGRDPGDACSTTRRATTGPSRRPSRS